MRASGVGAAIDADDRARTGHDVRETRSTVMGPDGTLLAWRGEGEGPPLLFCNGLANDAFQWGAVHHTLAARGHAITWDYPGHGDSEPARSDDAVTIPSLAVAAMRVLDAAAGPDARAVLLGYSTGCQLALEAWRAHPDRVAGMVLALGTPGRPFDTFFGGRALGAIAHVALEATPPRLLGAAMGVGSRLGALSFRSSQALGVVEKGIDYDTFAPWLDHLGRLDARSFRAMGLAAQRHTGEDVLPTVTVPTLVVAGGTDVFTPPERARAMDRALPDSELVFLPTAGHAGLVGHGAAIADEVEGFLTRRGLLGGEG